MNKTFWWIVAVVVVVLAIYYGMNGGSMPYNEYGSPSPSTSVSPSGTTSSGSGATTAYTALVKQYGTNRIQFDALCQAIPKTAVFKAGTKVMFDNRSGDARNISIGGVKYVFQGYGYRIITLGGPNLPATVYLNCGTAVNVGTITVEK